MRIAIMAAGAVGGYFGGRLAAAGNDVTFIARGTSRIWRLFHDGVDAFRVAGLREPLMASFPAQTNARRAEVDVLGLVFIVQAPH